MHVLNDPEGSILVVSSAPVQGRSISRYITGSKSLKSSLPAISMSLAIALRRLLETEPLHHPRVKQKLFGSGPFFRKPA